MSGFVPTLEQIVARMKGEILCDIAAGRVAADVRSFSELHDHVDANCYGGFCDQAFADALAAHFGGGSEREGMPDGMVGYLNAAQASINNWIVDGGLLNAINDIGDDPQCPAARPRP